MNLKEFFSQDFFTRCGHEPCRFIDYIPVLTGVLAVLVATFGVWKYLDEKRRDRELSESDRIWRHHQEARKFITEFRASPFIEDALRMIDYSSFDYRVPGLDGLTTIDHDAVEQGLRTTSMSLTEIDEYVGKCFDELLVLVGEIHYFAKQDQVSIDYFVPSLGWYAFRAKQQTYIRIYGEFFGLDYSWETLMVISDAFEERQQT